MAAEPKYATPRNLERRTLGPEVRTIMERMGTPAMPWQAQVVDVCYEVDEERAETGALPPGVERENFLPLFYREGRVTVQRQSGKTTKALARHIHRHTIGPSHGWGRRPVSLYLAQSAMASQDKMLEEWAPAIEDSPYLSDVAQVIRSNGRAAIRWNPPGGRILTAPPNKKGGHGVTGVDLVDIDEAFAHRDGAAEQGVGPTQITRVSPQIYITSTAGDATSEYLWGKVDDGRARCESGKYGRIAYFEWASPKDADLLDPEVLLRDHPAAGLTQPIEALIHAIESMASGKEGMDGARRAYGNIWTASAKRIIPAAAWAACMDLESQIVGRVTLAADASPSLDNRWATITASGLNARGRVHSEIVDRRPGVDWLADRLADLEQSWLSIYRLMLDPTGPIGTVLPTIVEKTYVEVVETDASTMANACGRFHADILAEGVAHLGQEALDSAAEGAAKRTLLDRWAWARRTSAEDISPLVAATLGHWDVVTNPDSPLEMG